MRELGWEFCGSFWTHKVKAQRFRQNLGAFFIRNLVAQTKSFVPTFDLQMCHLNIIILSMTLLFPHMAMQALLGSSAAGPSLYHHDASLHLLRSQLALFFGYLLACRSHELLRASHKEVGLSCRFAVLRHFDWDFQR